MTVENYYLISTILATISGIGGLIVLGFTFWQIRKLNTQVSEAVKSNRISQLGTFLEVEAQIRNSRRELVNASLLKQGIDNVSSSEYDSASLYEEECIENHLNTLDRLCFCILKDYFDNDEMKLEYREVINNAVKNNPESFNASSEHRNILKIREKWADS